MLGSELLGISQVIVYTGAIMVLFLFVVMLLNLGGPNMLRESRDLKRLFGAVFGIALFAIVFVQALIPLRELNQPSMPSELGRPEAIGRALLTTYAWPFEVVSILLLVGVVGSILLAKRKI
jgi:NADH-quinone oxidoreductase subunit J